MRYIQHLKGQYKALLGYAGMIILLIAVTILSPLLMLPFYPDELNHTWDFVIPGLPLLVLGWWLRRRYLPKTPFSLTVQEGMVVVVLSWTAAIVFGALPFIIGGHMGFTQSLFESTSGWTSTGLSVVDVTQMPRAILLYRSVIQLVGGAGFVIIVLSAITGPTGTGLPSAEGHTEQFAPNVRRSAEIVVRMYAAYNIFGILALRLAGMGWFDAVNHAFTATATAGFSTRAGSIGEFDSVAVEMVIMILMLLGSIHFLTVLMLLRRRFKAVRKNGELRLMGILIAVSVTLMFFFVGLGQFGAVGMALRQALFESISAVSTAGFNITDYSAMAPIGWLVLTLLMIIGGNTGSTAGAIKQFRIFALFKAAAWEIERAFLPRNTMNRPEIWRGPERTFLTNEMVREAALYVFVYMSTLFLGVGIVSAHGYPIGDSLFEVASAIGTVGLSVGVTAADAPPGVLWTLMSVMVIGRLEFFAVVIGVTKLLRDGVTLVRPALAQNP